MIFLFKLLKTFAPHKKEMLIHNLCLITQLKNKQGGVSHYGLTIYMKKYLKAKEELWKIKYFTIQKNIIFKKILRKKKPKSFQEIITLQLISSSNTSQNIIFQI